MYPDLDFLARFRPNKLWLLLKTGVSGLLRYFGSPSPRMRPEKAMTFPRTSMTGNIRRFRKASYTPPFLPRRTRPAS